MKRVLALLVAVGAVAALEAPSTASSCDPPLVFEGRTYRGTASEAASGQAKVAGTGTLHGCATVEGQPPPREVVVRALHDVPAGVAVAREGDTYSVWLREGFFPQLRSHPLHDTVTIRRPGRLRCGSRVVRRDHVPSQPSELDRCDCGRGSPRSASRRARASQAGCFTDCRSSGRATRSPSPGVAA